jgi:YXWGXW repeat-containing protein
MRKLVAGLISFSLMCGPCAIAQGTDTAATSNFPTSGYLQFPPHFQPRPANASDKITVAPPPLPLYSQPALPKQGYVWMPGFWAWRKDVGDYYWVPGTWVQPPRRGFLWTPPYWSRVDGGYVFHAGYWADAIGFYGGIDYGGGYAGDGYQGGRWDNGTFFYNRAANNLGSLNVSHVYDEPIPDGGTPTRIGFNGGRGGTKAQPTQQQEQLARLPHVEPTSEQLQHFEMAAKDRALYSKLNQGEPGVAATSHASLFEGGGITRSSGLTDGSAEPKSITTTGANLK